MNQFYSILKISTNNSYNEAIGIGILLFYKNEFKYYFSNNRIKTVQKLINSDLSIKNVVKYFKTGIDNINSEFKNNSFMNSFQEVSKSNYFDYLNIYSKGLIQFSEPIYYDSSNMDFDFGKLVKMFFNETEEVKFYEENCFSSVKKIVNQNLVNRVENKVHTNFEFNNSIIESLFFNFEMDCIGKNGVIIGAKSIDFTQSEQTIQNHINQYYTIISTTSCKYQKDIEKNKFFLIAEEPNLNNSKKRIFNACIKSELIDVITPEKSSIVAEIIEEKNATTFIE